MLMTAHEGIGEDANAFFRNLTLGNLHGEYRYLGVAPAGLKPLVMDGLDREIARARAGMPAHAFFQMNSLTDREVIDKIAEASRVGVRVDMIIRGISCMLPGIEGSTDNVHIRSIVGRFLEHARVYSFGEEADTVYLSSADMMTRNTEHRVEIAYPVLDPTCRAMVRDYMADQLRDNVKARELDARGRWVPVSRAEGEAPFNAQEHFMTQAIRRARAAEGTRPDCGRGGAPCTRRAQGPPNPCPARAHKHLPAKGDKSGRGDRHRAGSPARRGTLQARLAHDRERLQGDALLAAFQLLARLEPCHLELVELVASGGDGILLGGERGEVGGIDVEHPPLQLLDLGATRLHLAFEGGDLLFEALALRIREPILRTLSARLPGSVRRRLRSPPDRH